MFLIELLQDLFVDRLVQEVDELREKISMYEYQLRVQSALIEREREEMTNLFSQFSGRNEEFEKHIDRSEIGM